jgi:hypothetical protein
LVGACCKIARHLSSLLGLHTLDFSIYSSRRLWRLSNTRRDNGCWKIELDPMEVLLERDAIIELSQTPRPAFYEGRDILG